MGAGNLTAAEPALAGGEPRRLATRRLSAAERGAAVGGADRHNSSHNATEGVWPSVLAPYGVVNFMFMTIGSLPHASIWKMFFAEAPRRSWRAYIHCKDPDACARSGLSLELPEVKQVSTMPSWYCHDLVTAMVHLLKTAIDESPSTGGAGSVEKFVFVSDSTLPIKPFAEVHATLTSTDDSDICIFPQEQWASANIDGHDVKMVKHHQWVVLNREHAEKMVRDWQPVDSRGVWHVPLMGGSWAGKERKLSPQHFNRAPNANWCTDEWAFFTTIFGVFEPFASGSRSYANFGSVSQYLPGQLQGKCRTFTFWDDGGEEFRSLGGAISADPSSKMSCFPKCWQHPATLEALSDTALGALRRSSFLFARKMSPNLWMPNYYGIVLHSDAKA